MSLGSEAATEALGARIARGLHAGDVVLLSGELGAGKTALARAVLRTLGVSEHVPSPTFTLVQSYETPGLIVRHLDLYRVENARELDELGLDEALDEGAILVEWPERAPDRWPEDALHIGLVIVGENSREATVSGPMRWREFLAQP
jgi:tRNA threonylcarbamoyladenosine biosynthesis protein TsaE